MSTSDVGSSSPHCSLCLAIHEAPVTAPGPGNVRVPGWAREPDTAGPSQVRVDIDGVAAGTWNADRARGDAMNGHGFDILVTGVAPGTRTVCVTALDTGGGPEVRLGCVASGVTAVAAGQVTTLEGTDTGIRLASTSVRRTDGSPAWIRVLVDGRFRATLRPGPDGLEHGLDLPPGDHEVVVTATVDGRRSIPTVLASASVRVEGELL